MLYQEPSNTLANGDFQSEIGDHSTGHIEQGTNEGILFFDRESVKG